jgi:lysophospholipase L1-like esterase
MVNKLFKTSSAKTIYIIFLLIFFYFVITIFLYVFSSILLINKKVIDFPLIRDYQRNFYHQLGYRKIWQTQEECVESDSNLIFRPAMGKCIFKNIEFSTELNFNMNGRITNNNLTENNNGIVILGDSHAMGWGVNDEETFASLLEKKINKKVYNLAVSGYATKRELERLRVSNLFEKIDTIIIQYCNNDYHENLSSINKIESIDENKKFLQLLSAEMSFFERFRKGIRYSLTIPFHLIKDKKNYLDWGHHEELFNAIIKKYDFLEKKRIIVIYSNGINQNFYNFPNTVSEKFSNVEYIDISYNKGDFFLIDGHLTSRGHAKIAKSLYERIQTKEIK